MTKIIQIIGLPCAGKTTLIKKYINKYPDIKHIDIADFTGKTRQKEYKKRIINTSGNIIAESACGVSLKNSEVIELKTDMKTIYEIDQSIVAKKTIDRVKLAFDDVNLEIENCIQTWFFLSCNIMSKTVLQYIF